jgi:hypothetical protein
MYKSKKVEIDALICYLFIKKLMTPILSMPAYRKGLIDSAGRVVKEPITKSDEESLTLLDKIVLKIKRLLGPRVASLNQFLYTQTLGLNMYNSIICMGSPTTRAEIIRVSKDLKRLMESNKMSVEDTVLLLLEEDLNNSTQEEIIL